MAKWSLNDRTLILDGKGHISNIKHIRSSVFVLHIEVFLFDGKKFTLNLNSYDGTGRKLSDECRSSRSTFLDWLKEEKIVNEDVFSEFNNLCTKEQEEKSEEIVSVADKSNEDNCSKETVEEKQKEIENFIHQEEIDETVDNNLDDELEGDGNKEEGEDNEIEGNNSKVEGDDVIP